MHQEEMEVNQLVSFSNPVVPDSLLCNNFWDDTIHDIICHSDELALATVSTNGVICTWSVFRTDRFGNRRPPPKSVGIWI